MLLIKTLLIASVLTYAAQDYYKILTAPPEPVPVDIVIQRTVTTGWGTCPACNLQWFGGHVCGDCGTWLDHDTTTIQY